MKKKKMKMMKRETVPHVKIIIQNLKTLQKMVIIREIRKKIKTILKKAKIMKMKKMIMKKKK